MTDGTLLRAVRHNCWANDRLIQFCAGLRAEQLARTVPGTYGSIHKTLHHIVAAEHGYLFRLTGHRPPIEEERGGRVMTGDWLCPLPELRERARSNAERMEAALAGAVSGAPAPTPVAKPSPFRVLPPSEVRQFENSIPLYPLAVAAGAFAAGDAPEPEAWVEPLGRTKPRPGTFVARVVGRSMEHAIPDGAYCVFRHPVEGSRQGRILLVEHRAISDPDTGGTYTVKRYESQKVAAEDGEWRHERISLLPDTDAPGYAPILLEPTDAADLRVIAELVEALPGGLSS